MPLEPRKLRRPRIRAVETSYLRRRQYGTLRATGKIPINETVRKWTQLTRFIDDKRTPTPAEFIAYAERILRSNFSNQKYQTFIKAVRHRMTIVERNYKQATPGYGSKFLQDMGRLRELLKEGHEGYYKYMRVEFYKKLSEVIEEDVKRLHKRPQYKYAKSPHEQLVKLALQALSRNPRSFI